MSSHREDTAPTDLADASASELIAGYRDGRFSPVEVLEAVHARIDAVEPTVRALYAPQPEAARAAAHDSEQRWRAGAPCGPLDGVPITVKENIATAGTPVPGGTAASQLTPAAADAPPAERVRAAGAVLVAKTTMPDMGMLTSGRSSFHPLTRNPWNPDWNPGGSSAGAGAAAAAGFGPLHIGSDIGGSIRLPAGWCAVAGLKPSWGRAATDPPYYGRAPGPMTRTVADASLLMSVLAGPDERDPTSLPDDGPDWGLDDVEVAGWRVAVLSDAGCGLPVDAEVAAAVDRAAQTFADAGAHVEPIAPFFTRQMLDDIDLLWRVRGWTEFRELDHDRQHAVLAYIADWCRGGADVPGAVVMRCLNRMLEVGRATLDATAAYDLVISPVAPVATYPAHWHAPTNDHTRTMEHIAFTVPYNFSHQPAASVNAGFTAEGKPIGVQLAARRFADPTALAAAAFFERARPDDAVPRWPPPVVGAS